MGAGKAEAEQKDEAGDAVYLLQGRNNLCPIPPFLRLREKVQWWQAAGATTEVLSTITRGVEADWPEPLLTWHPSIRSREDQESALEVLSEYLTIGAAKRVSLEGTKFLVPWFVLKKEENGKQKLRLISDCRKLNGFLHPKHFKLDHWRDIFPF